MQSYHPAMTEELFRADAQLRSCEATLLAIDAETGALLLDRTVFYPQGGGQAGDAGELDFGDGRVLRIADTRKGSAPGSIAHLAADEARPLLGTLRPGQRLVARIDWARRHRHMRFHTATHLLCALVPHKVDGCSITAAYARLDFHMTEPLEKDALGEGLTKLIAADHPVRPRWISDDELDANPALVRSMSVQPPRGTGRVRLLEIDGVDLQPCGGTHVASTAEIGGLRVTKIEKKSAMTRRVVLGFAEAVEAA